MNEFYESQDIEQCAIGSMLLSDRAADEILGILDVEHFYAKSHQMMFGVIQEMRLRGIGVDFATAAEWLKRVNRLGDIGGEDYFSVLCEKVPSPSNSRYYADLVKEHWVRREWVKHGEIAKDPDVTPDDLLQNVVRIQNACSSGTPARSGKLGDFAGKETKRGVATGFSMIDNFTACKGLADGQMALVLSGSGGGKTAFSLQVALNAARQGKSVLFATFVDMSAEELADRMTKSICGWSHEPPENHSDFERYHQAVQEIRDLPIHVYDASELMHGRDVETFAAWFEARLPKEKYRLVVLDYAQELTSRIARSEYDHADNASKCIRWMAARSEVPFLVGSQITPGNEKLGTEAITKGSRKWMERASLILDIRTLSEEEAEKVPGIYSSIPGLTLAKILKNRFGKKNLKAWWKWSSDTVNFQELA